MSRAGVGATRTCFISQNIYELLGGFPTDNADLRLLNSVSQDLERPARPDDKVSQDLIPRSITSIYVYMYMRVGTSMAGVLSHSK